MMMRKKMGRTALTLLLAALSLPVWATSPRDVDMTWWRDSKYGLFMHWGLYSVIGGEWKGKGGYGEFVQLNARIPVKEMWEVAKTFNPTQFNAEEWVKYAVDAGMKYLVITSKHHEGFAMYDSEASKFNMVDATPFGRDPLKELSDACDKYGIKFCVYYSLGRDWEDPDVSSNWPRVGGRSNDWDFPDEANKRFERYFERKLRPQVIELLKNYNVHVLWFDTEGPCTPSQSQALIDLVEQYRPGCLINDRVGNGLGDFVTPEQKSVDEISREPWESCITIGTNWGYVKRDTVYKSPEVIARLLTDIVSKGGNLLLNVGPTPWGTFQPMAVDYLRQVGGWLKVNGEAVYGTRPWLVYGEAATREKITIQASDKPDEVKDETAKGTEPDIRFTSKPGVLYVIARSWKNPRVTVQDLLLTPEQQIQKVELLGYSGTIDYALQGHGIDMELPAKYRPEIPLYVYKLTLSE